MKLNDLTRPIFEAPIDDYALIGRWGDKERSHSFSDERDRRLVQNPKMIEKVRQKFGQTEVVMNFYFVNLPGAGKLAERGFVSTDWLSDNMPQAWQDIASRQTQQDTDWKNAVNVIFVGNAGFRKIPMTPWMMAHRIGHAINASDRGWREPGSPVQNAVYHWNEIRNDIQRTTMDIFREVYGIDTQTRYRTGRKYFWDDKIVAKFYEQIGTMLSARQGNLGGRAGEFVYELFAQHITTGKIQFNPIPEVFGTKGEGYWRMQHNPDEDREYGEYMLNRGLALMLPDHFDSALYSLYGEFLVM